MANKKSADKPTIFIASSGKSSDVAEAVKLNLDKEADVDIWTENIFQLNDGTLETLMNRASYYDFFIAVFAADDVATHQAQGSSPVPASLLIPAS